MTGHDEDSVPRCGHWIGAEQRHCHAIEGLHPFLQGIRCPLHTPSALAGKPEVPPGPGMPAGAWSTPSPQSASAVFDEAAIRKSKRRSSPAAFRAAQASARRKPETPAPGIRLDPGQKDARGQAWIRIPTADYLCPGCGETESASGDQVAHFARHIETEHAERCTANPQGAPTT